jgi:glycosyltransferase involved in cell wall biosynthesis
MAAVAPKPIHILQLGPGLTVRGGVSTVERLIVESLGADVSIRHVATMEDGSPLKKLRVFWQAVRTLRKELASETPIIVHIHFSSRGSTLRKILLARMALRAHRPVVLHAHGSMFAEFFNGLPRFLQRIVGTNLSRADRIIVLSKQWKEFYTTRCGLAEKSVIIFCNPAAMPETVPDRSAHARVQFLFLGRIGQRKGAFDLLRAFAQLPSDIRQRARLVFAGDGEVDELRARAKALGDQVDVHSWINIQQRNELLAASDVFVLPSHHEGVPMALLEAMGAGLPVITTPVGGIPDVVDDQQEGVLVTPGDVPALSAALQLMITDAHRRNEFAQRARQRAEGLSVGAYIQELTRLYRDLMVTDAPGKATS